MRARLSDDQGWRKNRHDHHKGCARTPTSDRVSPQLSTTHSDFAEPVRDRVGRERLGARTLHPPRDLLILVEQSAESVVSS